MSHDDSLKHFHPGVSNWFTKEFARATEIQSLAWPAIKEKQNVLIAAPTGSGKTLAAFLSAIDDLIRLGLDGGLAEQTHVVYVSPLKALSNDIERNLQRPLTGILEELKNLSLPEVPLRVQVRTGDTPASERTAMTKHPPHILVTTPESLFLLVTSDSGRKMLAHVHTLIVDEIHALVRDKRGSHLALSIERLQALTDHPLVRVGISATQKPIEDIARFLVGGHSERSKESPEWKHSDEQEDPSPARQARSSQDDTRINCTIIDAGHRRNLDLSIEVPRSPLTAVMASEVWTEIHERLIALIHEHQTTLIFVNTRRLAERLSHFLAEQLGSDIVRAHHGSMSKELRFDAEQRLKAGSLRALVATASLELGIDIGSVDLVCQISSPRSIATFLQRVGRSGHSITGTPKGKLFPLTRDELVECCALFDAVRRGELDRIVIPEKPIDILAQQIVAEVSAREYTEDEMFALVSRAYPYRNLTRREFDEVIEMLGDGFTTRRGKRGAYLHHDTVNQRLRARRGARLSAITSGGAIPDAFDYDVIMEPTNTFIGTLNEDFAIESSAGDIFQLGNNSWKILRVENGKVRVADAGHASPTIPFWLGEAPGRTVELSFAVSRLREEISKRLGDWERSEESQILTQEKKAGDFSSARPVGTPQNDSLWKQSALDWLVNEVGIEASAADQAVIYLATGQAALEVMPTQTTIVLERFFDEAGDMHVVIHSPYGNRMNRAWGLSLRKRFCRKFNFELQAAATEDAIVLSLGSTHSFPVEEVFTYLNSKTVRDILVQAVFDSPMFEVRWRWNATRSLALLRRRNGKKIPANLQRMNAQDLVALIFPDQLACLENIAGDREVPDHPLVRQTIQDCLYEAMAVEALEQLLRRMEAGDVQLIAKDLREPSVLAQEILNARPYAFLDDAPLEERRTRAVANRRWLDPSEAKDLGKLDEAAIEAVKMQAWPEAENKDELHDALVMLGFLASEEIEANPEWRIFFSELVADRRASVLKHHDHALCIAVERLPQWKAILDTYSLSPELEIPGKLLNQIWTKERALVEIVRGRLEGLGPVRAIRIADSSGIPISEIAQALTALEVEGFAFQGKFTPHQLETEWCERRLLARIHRYTLEKLRKEIEAVSPADFMRFLFAWHRVEPGQKPEGQEALQVVLNQLEGFEAPAAAWEGDLLPARLADYDFSWLDLSCMSGKTAWGRFRVSSSSQAKPGGPVKSTPIMLVKRANLDLWRDSSGNEISRGQLSHPAQAIFEYLQNHGASFFAEMIKGANLLSGQAEEGVAELVAAGLITADSFSGLRALLVPAKYKLPGDAQRRPHRNPFRMDQAGRWSLLSNDGGSRSPEAAVPPPAGYDGNEFIARVLLRRYGVVFRKISESENISPPWRELARVYRRMEARGEIRGGRFVDGVWGEQFALPEALTKLRTIRKEQKNGTLISISAVDPLNLEGILTPGKRVPAFTNNRILYRDGVPVAVFEGGEVNFLSDKDEGEKWKWQNVLIQKTIPPKLRAYLGKGIA